MFNHFRANQVDQVYSEGGFTLEKEGELDLFANQFAWDARLLSLSADDLNTSVPSLFTLTFSTQPEIKDSLEISYGQTEKSFVFVQEITDNNSSEIQVAIGDKSDNYEKFDKVLEKRKIRF